MHTFLQPSDHETNAAVYACTDYIYSLLSRGKVEFHRPATIQI